MLFLLQRRRLRGDKIGLYKMKKDRVDSWTLFPSWKYWHQGEREKVFKIFFTQRSMKHTAWGNGRSSYESTI